MSNTSKKALAQRKEATTKQPSQSSSSTQIEIKKEESDESPSYLVTGIAVALGIGGSVFAFMSSMVVTGCLVATATLAFAMYRANEHGLYAKAKDKFAEIKANRDAKKEEHKASVTLEAKVA
jgi:hypothetical protein